MDNGPLVILESERLIFRQHIMADRDAYCAMDMDADVRRYVGGKPRTRAEAERRFSGALTPTADQLGMCATILKSEGKYVGRCGIYPHFRDDSSIISGEASLGLYIARDYWGRGIATEAAAAFIDLGFNKLEINRVVTMMEVGNDASVRVLEKLGFAVFRTETGGPREFFHFELKRPAKTGG